MKADRRLLLISILIVVFIKFFTAFPLDDSFPGGVDTSAHLFKTWFISENGIANWNYYWNGGDASLRNYPIVSYVIPAALSKLTGYLFAYKFVNNVFIVLAPLAFVAFLREFKLPINKTIMAAVLFSFIPIYSYYFADGRYPSLASIVFSILYWIFLKRTLDGKGVKNVLISGMFLGLAFLTHHATTIMILPITFVWSIVYKMKLKTVLKFSAIVLIGLVLSSWWLFPFLSDMLNIRQAENVGRITNVPNPIETQKEIIAQILSLNIFTSNLGPKFIIVFSFATFLFLIISLFTIKDKITREFLVVSIVIVLIIFFVRTKRALIFLPIPMSILLTQGLSILRGKIKMISFIFLTTIFLFSFFSILPKNYKNWDYPQIPKDGRVIFLPFTVEYEDSYKDYKHAYSIFLSPIHGNENIFEWAISDEETIGKSVTVQSIEKLKYNFMLSSPLKLNQIEYSRLLKYGNVNYIVVKKNSTDFVNYFNESEIFKLIGTSERFFVFELTLKSKYIELNDKDVDADVEKNIDNLKIKLNCESGDIVIKETYNKRWEASINDKLTSIEKTENVFMKIKSDETGSCKINLVFKNNWLDLIFYLISIVSSLSILILLIIFR